MNRNREPPPIAEIRDYAQEKAELTSLRILAKEIGLGHSTLHNFVGGAAPHPRVRRKLLDWYRVSTGDLADHHAVQAIRVLLEEMTPARQEHAAGVILNQLERLYIDACCPVPGWVAAAIERREFGRPAVAGTAPASAQQ